MSGARPLRAATWRAAPRCRPAIGASVAEWASLAPAGTGAYEADVARYGAFWSRSADLLGTPAGEAEAECRRGRGGGGDPVGGAGLARALPVRACRARLRHATAGRARFLRRRTSWHGAPPRWCPASSRREEEVAAEARLDQGDKDGVEIDQGIFLAHVLARPGRRPPPLPRLAAAAPRERRSWPRASPGTTASTSAPRGWSGCGEAAVLLTAANPRFLNAEDDSTLDRMEAAVDVAILDRREHDRGHAGRPGGPPALRRPAGLRRRDQPDASLPRPHPVPLVPASATWAGSTRSCAASPRRTSLPDDVTRHRHREALGRGGRRLRDRRPLPGAALHGLHDRRRGRLHDPAGAQGGDHPRPRQHADAALHRRPDRPPGHPVRRANSLRQPGGPPDLRRDRAAPRRWTRRSSA